MSQIVDCSEFCRLCLVKEQVNTPIFEEDGGYHQLSTKISTCLPVKVSREDSLPKRICDGCCYKVEQQYQFWNISLNAEKQFKQWLGISEDTETAKQNVNKIKKESTYDGPSASKRPKRNARRKAVQNIRQATAAQQSDSDSDIPLAARTVAPSIEVEPIAKDENDSDHHDFPEDNDSMDPPNFVNMNLEGEQDQAGPSGLQKAESTEPVEAAPATLNMEIEAGEGYCAVDLIKTESVDFDVLKTVKSENSMSLGEVIKNETSVKLKTKQTSTKPTKRKLEKSIKCPDCPRMFAETNKLRYHRVVHTGERPYKCAICSKTFKFSHSVPVHMKTHEQERFECDICQRSFSQKGGLREHTRKHFKDYRHFCEMCGKGFYSPYQLENHLKEKHLKSAFVCNVCGASFSTAYAFKQHKATHRSKRPEVFYPCDYCEKSFTMRSIWREHIKRKHMGARKCVCDICGKNLSSTQSLRDHLLLHSGEKPLKCDVCGKCFAKKTILKVHQRTHTGEKPYECPQCSRRFTQRSSLMIHIRYHTGDRPYKCNFCDNGFVTKTLMKEHQKKQHCIVPSVGN